MPQSPLTLGWQQPPFSEQDGAGMLLMRLLGVFVLLFVSGGIAAYLLTRNPKYLHFSWQVFRYAAMVALLIFGLLILERVAIIPL